jgi:hypothetical protein
MAPPAASVASGRQPSATEARQGVAVAAGQRGHRRERLASRRPCATAGSVRVAQCRHAGRRGRARRRLLDGAQRRDPSTCAGLSWPASGCSAVRRVATAASIVRGLRRSCIGCWGRGPARRGRAAAGCAPPLDHRGGVHPGAFSSAAAGLGPLRAAAARWTGSALWLAVLVVPRANTGRIGSDVHAQDRPPARSCWWPGYGGFHRLAWERARAAAQLAARRTVQGGPAGRAAQHGDPARTRRRLRRAGGRAGDRRRAHIRRCGP